MSKYKSISLQNEKYFLKEPKVTTWNDRNQELNGYAHVFIDDDGEQFMPYNVHFQKVTGNFKVIWMTDSWVGISPNMGYKKIEKGYPLYVVHKAGNSYLLVKEYAEVSTIERYFEILDYYQNFKNSDYVDLMVELANTTAKFRDIIGVNKYLSEQLGKNIIGLEPVQAITHINGADESALQKLKAALIKVD